MRLLASLLALSLPLAAAEPTADEIINRYLDGQKVETEMVFIKMTLERPLAKPVERRFLAAFRDNGDGSFGSFVRLVRPTEVEGVTVLANRDAQGEDAQYLFLPAIGRARPLTAAAKSEPFLGSDFSIEDLVREVPSAHHYERREDAKVGDSDCYVVRAVEKEKSGSAYLHRDLFIDQTNHQLLKVDYYGANGEVLKRLHATDYDSPDVKGETTRPREAVMEREDTGSKTTFTAIEARINEPIEAELFTPEKIADWPPHEVEEFVFQLGFTMVPGE